MDRAFLQERIEKTKALIVAYEDALAALGGSGAVQSYKLDTGQDSQSVTRADIPRLNEMLDSLYNRCATFEARLNGSGATHVRPCW